MLALLTVCLLGHGPSLATIHEIALADLKANVAPASQIYTRYLSMHGVPEETRADFTTGLKLALNGASIRGEFHVPKPVAGGRLLRIDLRGLGWDRFSREIELEKLEKLGVKSLTFKNDRDKQFFLDFWEFLAYFEPFFVANGANGNPYTRGWLDPAAVAEAKRLAGTEKLIISAHWLLPRLVLERQDGGFYSQLLFVPPKEEDLYKRLGVDIPFADLDTRAKHGAAVPESASVAYQNREIQFLASSTGYDQHWLSRTLDFASSGDRDKDVREFPAGTSKKDATEILWSLMNGLMAGALYNAQGVQQNIAPQTVAEDRRETRPGVYYCPTKTVVNMIKCLDCHGESRGLIGFSDAARPLIAPPRLDTAYVVFGRDPKKVALETQRVEDFYREGLREKVALYRDSYEARVQALTGLPVLEATRALLKSYDAFTTAFKAELVKPEQAAREMALPVEGARALWRASGESQLNILAAGQGVSRALWEKVFHAAMEKDVYRWDLIPKSGLPH